MPSVSASSSSSTVAYVSASPTAAPPSTAAAGACTSGDFAISAVDSFAGLGAVGGYLRFENVGTESCVLTGWPNLVGVTVGGSRAIATHSTAILDYPPDAGMPDVIIAPGESAFAGFQGGDNPTGDARTCPPSYRTLEVSAPGTTKTVSISAYNAWLGQDLTSCSGIEVTPVIAQDLVPSLSSLRP
jgi:hypothetical protein